MCIALIILKANIDKISHNQRTKVGRAVAHAISFIFYVLSYIISIISDYFENERYDSIGWVIVALFGSVAMMLLHNLLWHLSAKEALL